MRWRLPRTMLGAVAIALLLISTSAGSVPEKRGTPTTAAPAASTTTTPPCDVSCLIWVLRIDTPAEQGNFAAWVVGHDVINWLSRAAPDAGVLRALRVCETGWVDGVFYPDGKSDHYTSSYEGPYGMTHDTFRIYSEQVGATPGVGWPSHASSAFGAQPWQVDMVARHLIRLYGYEPWPVCGKRL